MQREQGNHTTIHRDSTKKWQHDDGGNADVATQDKVSLIKIKAKIGIFNFLKLKKNWGLKNGQYYFFKDVPTEGGSIFFGGVERGGK